MTSQKYGILEKENGVFHVVNSKLNGYQLSLNKDDNIIEEFNQLVKKISEFSSSFPQEYKIEEVERGLLNFIDLHGADMLLGFLQATFLDHLSLLLGMFPFAYSKLFLCLLKNNRLTVPF